MDNESYYDSLEEDFSSASSSSINFDMNNAALRVLSDKPQKGNLNSKNSNFSSIPLYNGDTLIKQSTSNPSFNNIASGELNSNEKSERKQRFKMTCCKTSNGNHKSYLEIFYKRTGLPCAIDSSPSLKTSQEITNIDNIPTDIIRSQKSIEDTDHKSLEIISNSEVPTTESQSKKNINQKGILKLLPIPILGGLGASDPLGNRTQLERRKKQLNYGKNVNQRNKIKMKEIKILKNLKNNIEVSKATVNKN